MLKRLSTILIAMLFLGTMIASSAWDLPFGLRINRSNSLPHTLYVSVKATKDSFFRGALISFFHPYVNAKLAKRVCGLPGDAVAVRWHHVYVNETCVGPLFDVTPSGKALHPIDISIVPEGYLFVRGDHPESFDSRYAECGLIPIDSVQERLCPLF